MPKLFPISLEVEEIAVGRVMRALNTMPGVAKIKFDFLERRDESFGTNGHSAPRGPYKPRGPAKKYEMTGSELVMKVMSGKPPMSTAQLRDAFVAQGRSPSSINSVIHTMMKDNEVRITDDGYTLTKLARDRLRHRKGKKKK